MENLDPPPPHKIKDGKMARFCPSRGLILHLGGGDGGLLFHFILSKIWELSWVELRVVCDSSQLTISISSQLTKCFEDWRMYLGGGGGGGYELPPISATVKLCYTFRLKWHSFLPPHCLDPLQKNSFIGVIHNSVAERSARRTRNPVVPGSRPALATWWICSQ